MSERVPFQSYSMRIDNKQGRDWFDWCVFVDPSYGKMDEISSVEYVLHPTFPDPLRTASDPTNCFALFSSGWGDFNIGIVVWLKNGESKRQTFYLNLAEDSWPKGTVSQAAGDPAEQKLLKALSDSEFRWRKLTTLLSKTGYDEAMLRTILARLKEKNLARKAYFNSVDGQELWGATSTVGLAPVRK